MDKDSLKEQIIQDGLFRKDGKLNPAWLKWKAPKYDFSELEGSTLQEKIYLLFNDKGFCKICGKPTTFRDFSLAYPVTCSPECKRKYDANILKTKAIPRLKDKEVNNKRKQTCLERYGCDNVFKSKEIQKSIKNTLIKNYGVEHPCQNKEILQKAKNTTLQKYGKEYYTQTSEYKSKTKEILNDKISKYEKTNNCTEVQKLIEQYGQGWLSLNLPYLILGRYKFVENKYLPTIQKHYKEFQENRTHAEFEIEEFCRKLLPNEKILINDRSFLKSEKGIPLELDIYIPSKKVAIEYNGIYWHSLNDKYYHLYKTQSCEKLGIRLIHVWEDLWLSKKDIYKSIIASSLGCYQRKIFARKCKVKELDNNTYKNFLEKNHIQDKINTSSLRYGLFFKDELVMIAGWGKSRFKKGEYELHRMCPLLNTQVIGGFSKLISASGLSQFISYISRDIFSGSGYFKIGFSLEEVTEPGYFYCNNKLNRINRMSAQKHMLEKFLPYFNKNLTEIENMKNNGYLQIYDCGNIKVSWGK